MTPPKRTDEDAGRTMPAHPFDLCTGPHICEREIHCRTCDEGRVHPNHEVEVK